jgi:hypothetical protein
MIGIYYEHHMKRNVRYKNAQFLVMLQQAVYLFTTGLQTVKAIKNQPLKGMYDSGDCTILK